MKHIIILGDGMADEPIEQLGGKTPLMAANTPAFDSLSQKSRLGTLVTTPSGYEPGSEIAHLSLLGYDVPRVFEGRGSLEAASMGVEILPGEMAMRCNIICIENGKIKNHSAGNISTAEADELIKYLNVNMGEEAAKFFTGISYRHLLKIKGGCKDIICTPPHDVPGTPFRDCLVKAKTAEGEATAELINKMILRSQELLENHPVNVARKARGEDPANSIWPWSPGYKPCMETLAQKFGIKDGVVISAVDLIKGIGVYAGLKPIDVEGATGLWNTNYDGKAAAAINALRSGADFVFLHIEASDEAGHEGDVSLKVKTIESLDGVCGKILESLPSIGEPVAIAVLPDHPTPCARRTHSATPVPVMIFTPGVQGDGLEKYDETTAKAGSLGEMSGDEFIKIFLEK